MVCTTFFELYPGTYVEARHVYLNRKHVEVDLILPQGGHSLALEAVIREARKLEGAQNFRLKKKR